MTNPPTVVGTVGLPVSMVRAGRLCLRFGLSALFVLIAIVAVGFWLYFPIHRKPYLKVVKTNPQLGPAYITYQVFSPDGVVEVYWELHRGSTASLEEVVLKIDGATSRHYKARGAQREFGWAGETSDCMRARFDKLQDVVITHVDLDGLRWKDEESPTHQTEVTVPLRDDYWSQWRRDECFGLK